MSGGDEFVQPDHWGAGSGPVSGCYLSLEHDRFAQQLELVFGFERRWHHKQFSHRKHKRRVDYCPGSTPACWQLPVSGEWRLSNPALWHGWAGLFLAGFNEFGELDHHIKLHLHERIYVCGGPRFDQLFHPVLPVQPMMRPATLYRTWLRPAQILGNRPADGWITVHRPGDDGGERPPPH